MKMVYEDFYANYTEVDPGGPPGHIYIYPDQVETIYTSNFQRDMTAYVIRDFGFNFIQNFRLKFELLIALTEGAYCWWIPVGIADDIAAVNDCVGGEICIRVGSLAGGSSDRIIRLYEFDNGAVIQQSADYVPGHRHHYWCTFTRIGGDVILQIYSDPNRLNLLSTLTMSGVTEKAFRFFYACQSNSSGSMTRQMNGYSEFYEFEWQGWDNLFCKFEVGQGREDLFCKFVVNVP